MRPSVFLLISQIWDVESSLHQNSRCGIPRCNRGIGLLWRGWASGECRGYPR